MDVLQYIINHHIDIKSEMTNFLQDAGQTAEGWNRLSRRVQCKVKIDREYLYPEVSELSLAAKSLVEKSSIMLSQISELLRSASLALKANNQVQFLEQAVSLQLSVTLYFECIQKDLLPIMRAKMPTYVREELCEVIEDVVNEESADDLVMYA